MSAAAPAVAVQEEPAAAVGARRHHLTYLAMSVAVLVLSRALEVTTPTSVGLRAFGDEARLPPLCLLHSMTGWTCPGCGLTRGLVSLAHGDLATALAMHPLSPLFLVLVLWQLPYRAFMLRRGEWLPPRPLDRLHAWTARLTIAALIVTWLVRLRWGGAA